MQSWHIFAIRTATSAKKLVTTLVSRRSVILAKLGARGHKGFQRKREPGKSESRRGGEKEGGEGGSYYLGRGGIPLPHRYGFRVSSIEQAAMVAVVVVVVGGWWGWERE